MYSLLGVQTLQTECLLCFRGCMPSPPAVALGRGQCMMLPWVCVEDCPAPHPTLMNAWQWRRRSWTRLFDTTSGKATVICLAGKPPRRASKRDHPLRHSDVGAALLRWHVLVQPTLPPVAAVYTAHSGCYASLASSGGVMRNDGSKPGSIAFFVAKHGRRVGLPLWGTVCATARFVCRIETRLPVSTQRVLIACRRHGP